MSDTTLGAIVLGSVVVAALVCRCLPGGVSNKDVEAEAYKRLVGKIAEDRANARYASYSGVGGVVKLLVYAAAIGILVWLAVKNMDAGASVGP